MRLAFIGGNGHHYLKGALTDPLVKLSAIAVAGDGRDNVAAQRAAANLPGPIKPQWFDDPAVMLDNFKPDVVNIGAVYGVNGDMAALCLERDIPTLSDKPIAGSWAQLAGLRALLTANPRRILLSEFDFRSRAEFRAARQAVRDGLIGNVILATAQKSYRFGTSRPAWYASREDYTGTLLWIASHGIDAVPFTTGRRYTRAFGMQGNLSRPDYGSMEDHAVAMFELDNGGTALVHADFLRPAKALTHGDDRLRLAGSQGLIEVRDGRCVLTTHDSEPHDLTASLKVEPIHREFLSALLTGATDIYSTAESLEMAAVLLHARDAADHRKVVAIPN